MASHISNGSSNGAHSNGDFAGVPLNELPKSNIFTSNLPSDSEYPTPQDSHKAPRKELGPRLVKGALYTFVRPEGTQDPELLAVSHAAMRDIGLKQEEEKTQDFKDLVAGNRLMWDEKSGEGVYPWAQCYGGQARCTESGISTR